MLLKTKFPPVYNATQAKEKNRFMNGAVIFQDITFRLIRISLSLHLKPLMAKLKSALFQMMGLLLLRASKKYLEEYR